ncbi:MAG TPA: hypothetical protein VF816_08990 [Rhodocyclaceae bacterium]
MKNKLRALALLAILAAAPLALAQGGPGRGPGGGGGRYAIGQGNTVGWMLMTPEERAAHRQKMWSFSNYDDCKAYQAEHHQAMEARAKEQGKTLPAPRANACDRMKARGMLK